MRKLIIVALLAFAAVACFGQVDQIHYLSNAELAWDPVTTDAFGAPLLPTDVVSYEVYIYDYYTGVASDQDPAQLIAVGTPTAPLQAIDFTGYPRTAFAAGVRVKVVDGQGVTTYSQIAWSYDPVATDPTVPFLYVPMGVLLLPAPHGLRDAGM